MEKEKIRSVKGGREGGTIQNYVFLCISKNIFVYQKDIEPIELFRLDQLEYQLKVMNLTPFFQTCLSSLVKKSKIILRGSMRKCKVCLFVCVCERDRETERQRDRETERGRERVRERGRERSVCERVHVCDERCIVYRRRTHDRQIASVFQPKHVQPMSSLD